MTPVLRNLPYLFLTMELDAEWSRRGFLDAEDASNPSFNPFEHTKKCCEEYRGDIQNVASDYAKASGTEIGEPLAGYLYTPKLYLPEGHADCLAAVLVDDYDAVLQLATRCRTVESMSIGFCPCLDSLNLTNLSFLVSPHQLWESSRFEDSFNQPVLTLTKFKLDGACSLEYGLLFKRAILRAVANKCADALQALQDLAEAPYFSKEDVATAKVAFVSLQGQEEIGLFIVSDNATINMAVSSAIRTLTFHEIFRDLSDASVLMLYELLQRSPRPEELAKNGYTHGDLHRQILNNPGAADLASTDIPIFRWSKTTLAFCPDFGNDGRQTCGASLKGYVGLDLDFQLAPGFNHIPEKYASPAFHTVDLPNDWHLAQVGPSDCRDSVRTDRKLIAAHVSILHVAACIQDTIEKSKEGATSGIGGIRITFLVPVPSTRPLDTNGSKSTSPLGIELPKAVLRMARATDGGLGIEKLRTIPPLYGLPRPLLRSIETIVQKYLDALRNPNLFDLVADMTDAVVTLHKVLTVSLPSALKRADGSYSLIDEYKALRLSTYAAALQSAIERRLESAYPASAVRSNSVQFPGSFAQILFAADAPVKVGLGILKYHIRHYGRGGPDPIGGKLAALDGLGVITEPTLEPGIRTSDLVLGLKPAAAGGSTPRLSFINMDLDHLFHVGSYFDYAHEAFHLIFDELCRKTRDPQAQAAMRKLNHEDSNTRERIEETWVHIACFLFFAPNNPKSLLYYLIGKFALDVRSGGPDTAEALRNFAEQTSRLILATAVAEAAMKTQSDHAACPTFETVSALLKECIETMVLFSPEVCSLEMMHSEYFKSAIEEHFTIFWEEALLSIYLKPLWHIAINGFAVPLQDAMFGISANDRASFASDVASMRHGWALSRLSSGDRYLDSVAATAIFLGDYVTRFGDYFDHSVDLHLRRSREGRPTFEKARKSAVFLFDRGAAQRFCFTPAARAQRILHQIAILESFSDLASHFRARRVQAILSF